MIVEHQRRKMMYVHGFASSGSSGTVMTLRRHFPGWTVIAPDLPVDPFEALDLLHKLLNTENPEIVIGASMGGMYVQQLWGVKRIIVNPSFEMSRSLLFGKMGRNKYTSKRKDGATEFRIDKNIVERFKLMEKSQFEGVATEDKTLLTALFGDKDQVVNFRSQTERLYGKERCRSFAGEHRLNDETVKKVLLPIIDEMVDEGHCESSIVNGNYI